MAEDNKVIAAEVNWLCPVCSSSTNSLGIPFSGSRAVALHVAGKVRSGDSLHKSWAESKAGNIINEPEVKHSINTLADQLEWYVSEDNRTRRQQEEERVKRLVQEQKAKDDPRVSAYRYVQTIETSLHEFVRRILQASFGEEESGWWVKGVPPKIRIECAQKREEDSLREELYSYTNLIDLETIIDKNWKIFEPYFHQVRKSFNSKKEFLAGIAKTNEVRKRVMHPIRMKVSDEDIFSLEQFSKEIDIFVQGMR